MKYTYLFLCLLVSCMLFSCRNYNKELKALASTLNRNGTLIDMNEEVHMLIYAEDGCVKANDMDSCWIVFSPKKSLKTYVYQVSVEENGINVLAKKEKINLDKYNISYGKYVGHSTDIITDNKGKFSHFEFNIYPKDKSIINLYNYDSRNPEMLIPELKTTDFKNEFGEEIKNLDNSWHSISVSASLLSDKLNETYDFSGMKLNPLPGMLTIYFKTDKNGKVEKISDIMKYSNEVYGLLYKVETFKNIDEISNFYYNINMNIKEIQRKSYIESEKQNFIKIEDVKKAYNANFVRADEQYKGKRFKVACSLDQIKRNDNILFFTDYKYKLSYSSFFDGIYIEAYSNDENFADLNYPTNIYMEATLHSSGDKYIFTDCNLMMVE